MKLSVITVTFNSAATLPETLASVAEQRVPDLEYIIVDGGSRDATMDLVRAAPQVTKFISERDRGIYDAMNKGIGMATGDVIGIINSDDLYADAQVLTKVLACFEADDKLDAVFGDLSYFDTDSPSIVKRLWRSQPYRAGYFETGHVPPHPTLFVRKRVYDAIGTYYPNFRISSDYEFMLRMLKVNGYKSRHLPEVLVRMRLGGESTASWRNIVIGNREVLQAWRMNGLRPPLRLLLIRPVRKLSQLLFRG